MKWNLFILLFLTFFIIGKISAQLTISTYSVNSTCYLSCDGMIMSNTTGGTPPYTYLWTTGLTTQNATNLCIGTYSVTVTDASGNTATSLCQVLTSSFTSFGTSATPSTTSCNGTATATLNNGTPPFSFQWNTQPTQITATATNLCPGTYTVTVSDQYNCTVALTANVGNCNGLNATITSTSSFTSPCTGTASVQVSGGTTPYTYSWGTMPMQTTPTATALCPGNYSVTVTDNQNCSLTETINVPTDPCDGFLANIDIFSSYPNNCTGSATANVVNGTSPFSYLWSDSLAQTTQTINNLCPGNYSVTVTDSNGCTYSQGIVIDTLLLNLTISNNFDSIVNEFVQYGVTISNISVPNYSADNSPASNFAYFNNGNASNIGINDGIFLSTGYISNLDYDGHSIFNPSSIFLSKSLQIAGDNSVQSIANNTTYDASILEFDLIPTGNILSFNYVFTSEEYNEYVNSSYNDAFGLFLTGNNPAGGLYSNYNMAFLPGTNIPISINTVNNGQGNSGCSTGPCSNCQYFIDNCNGQFFAFDAYTAVLAATANVIPNQTYHLKIAVADVGDGIFDSGVLLQCPSLKSYNYSQIAVSDFEDIVIYPNPTSEFINIKFNSEFHDAIIKITNTTGKIMYEYNFDSYNGNIFSIDLSSFPQGLYNIEIINNKNHFQKRLLKIKAE